MVILNLEEAHILADIIRGKLGREAFFSHFGRTCSEGFDPDQHLSALEW